MVEVRVVVGTDTMAGSGSGAGGSGAGVGSVAFGVAVVVDTYVIERMPTGIRAARNPRVMIGR